MSDSIFQQAVNALATFRTDATGFATFLTGPDGGMASFVSAAGETVTVPTLRTELRIARDRIPDPTGQMAGAFIIINPMGTAVYSDFGFSLPVAGTARSNLPLVFGETAAGVRTISTLPYGFPLASTLSPGRSLVYDGTNLVASNYLIQNSNYFRAPGAGEPAIHRLAVVISQLQQDGTTTRTFSESAIRVPTGSQITQAVNQNKFFVSSMVDGEASLIQSSYQIPANTAGSVEGSILRVNAAGNLEFSTQTLAQVIDQETPPANFDFIRVSSNYPAGRLDINRSANLPPVDTNNVETFIDGSTQNNSQAKFVSASFLFRTEQSSRSGELVARFLGATDSMVEHYVTFGQIGTNIISSTLPWAANRDSVSDTTVIYREHDLVLHQGRRYYVNFDVTPVTNPVPGTNMTMGGATVDPSPFIPYNCGIIATANAAPFTAANQIIYSTTGDVIFLNPPASDGRDYILQSADITVSGIVRQRPTWVEAVPPTPRPLPEDRATQVANDGFDNARALPNISGAIVDGNLDAIGRHPTSRREYLPGAFLNQSRGIPFTDLGAPVTLIDDPTGQEDIRNQHGILGGSVNSFGSIILGGDGRIRISVNSSISTPNALESGWIPSSISTRGQFTLYVDDANNDFVRIFDTDNYASATGQNSTSPALYAFLE